MEVVRDSSVRLKKWKRQGEIKKPKTERKNEKKIERGIRRDRQIDR